jgi:hypothetical protein
LSVYNPLDFTYEEFMGTVLAKKFIYLPKELKRYESGGK